MPTTPLPHYFQRVDLVMSHLPGYWIDGPIKLARATGLGSSTIYQLIKGERMPSYRVAVKIADVLGAALGVHLDLRELFSLTPEFPTNICVLCGCAGCLPEVAFEESGDRKHHCRDLLGGDWSVKYLYPQLVIS